jgi:hypothetical protein
MTWGILTFTIIFSLIKILMTCLPTGVVDWIDSKFNVHKKLDESELTLTYKGTQVDGADKSRVIDFYNKGIMIEKYYVWPGTEEKFLNPESGVEPLKVHWTSGKREMTMYLFYHDTQVDIVKQYSKKLVAYSLYPNEEVAEIVKERVSFLQAN